jgi:uncharacterized protein YutE (UPF0331/DUF86 family)
MTSLDRALLAERVATVERHLARVSAKLPPDADDLRPGTDAADAVILHLWQAVQVVIDLAVSCCFTWHLGAPGNYGDAFLRLPANGYLDEGLAHRLVRAAGFRNVVAHAYDDLDLRRVYAAAVAGPDDLRAFLRVLRDRL